MHIQHLEMTDNTSNHDYTQRGPPTDDQSKANFRSCRWNEGAGAGFGLRERDGMNNNYGYHDVSPRRFRGGRSSFGEQESMMRQGQGASPQSPSGGWMNRSHGFQAQNRNAGSPRQYQKVGGMKPVTLFGNEANGVDTSNVWAEVETPEGKSYFYHAITKETTWNRPEGLGVIIVPHAECDNESKISQCVAGEKHPVSAVSSNSRSQSAITTNDIVVPIECVSPVSRQKPFKPAFRYSKHLHRKKFFPQLPRNQGNYHGGLPMPVFPNEPRTQGSPFPNNYDFPHGSQFHPCGFPDQMPMTSPPLFPAFPPMNIPPPHYRMGPCPTFYPNFNFPFSESTSMGGPGISPTEAQMLSEPQPSLNIRPKNDVNKKVLSKAKAEDWSEHTVDGRTYYHNCISTESVWEKPAVLVEFEEMLKSAMLNQTPSGRISVEKNVENESKAEIVDVKSKIYKDIKDEKRRPVASQPVPGTPWCVVWTEENQVFYYNPAIKKSVWQRPMELLSRLDVDEFVKNGPRKPATKINALSNGVEATSTTSPTTDKDFCAINRESVERDFRDYDGSPKEKVDVENKNNSGTPPPKKAKIECPLKLDNGPANSDATLENNDQSKSEDSKLRIVSASEAEAKAAKERDIIPFELRLEEFRTMLAEKGVSAFSTWEQELHKIVFDSRYLLLTSKERKAAFDSYVKVRAEEEWKEKKWKHDQAKKDFFELVSEFAKSQNEDRLEYFKFSQKHKEDKRFQSIKKSRSREEYFIEWNSSMMRQKRVNEEQYRKEKNAFLTYLKTKFPDHHVKWKYVQGNICLDQRFMHIEPHEKEILFRCHQSKLKAEVKSLKKCTEENTTGVRETDSRKPNGTLSCSRKERKHLPDMSEEEEGCISDDSNVSIGVTNLWKESEIASIREREREVQKVMEDTWRDHDNERKHHLFKLAILEYKSFLSDRCKSPDMSFNEVKDAAKQDARWGVISNLSKETLQEFYCQHCDKIMINRRKRFHQLLEETGVKITSRWRDIKKKIRDDSRCIKFSTARIREQEFDNYIMDIRTSMKSDFRQLLKETKLLTYRSKQQIRENANHMKNIKAILRKDKRYIVMDDMSEERQDLLLIYLDELETKGTPPPPTATDPIRKGKL